MKRTVLHLFSGMGGGGLGFMRAGVETLAAVDSDADASRDFEMFTGVRPHVADMHEMSPQELRDICGGQRPDIVFASPPCKGFSSCLPAKLANTPKYQKLNALTLRGIMVVLEAWASEPPPLILMENVPRIKTRGATWLRRIVALLQASGYSVDTRTHDCGTVGGLAQHRQRFLLVARSMKLVPNFLHHPPKLPMLTLGDVLYRLPVPLPGSTDGGPMHRLPRLSPKNHLRLSLIGAGKDWRSLPDRPVAVYPDGEYAPALDHAPRRGAYGVEDPSRPSHAITGHARVGHSYGSAVADVRLSPRGGRINGGFGVGGDDMASRAVVAEGTPRNTPCSFADARVNGSPRSTVYGVQDTGGTSSAVLAHARTDNGPFSVADGRVGAVDVSADCVRREGSLGVRELGGVSAAVISNATIHNWPAAVQDGRLAHATHRLVIDPELGIDGPLLDYEGGRPTDEVIIMALDGTWHRPMTTLELAAIQGFPVRWKDDWLKLCGTSHGAWRGRIGNAVPPPSAEAIAHEMLLTLDSVSFGLSFHPVTPVWVQPERGAADST